MLCLLLLIWLSASLHFLWCVNWMRLSEIWMTLWCCWHSLKKMRERTFLTVSRFFFLNVVVIWLMLLHFNDENWESFLNSWLSILAHFANHHIDFSASLNSCICNLKCMHFICWMILFLWSLCFRYSFHTFNVFYIFHMICNQFDFNFKSLLLNLMTLSRK